MHKMYFDNIFYQSDKITNQVECEKSNKEYDLFLLPHKYLDENLAAMYKDAFSHIKDGKPIVAVSQLHNYNMNGEHFYTTESYSTPIKNIKIDNSLLEEEFSLELLYQVAKETNSNSMFSSIFVSLDSKEAIKELSSILKKLKKENSETVFIISGNFTSFDNSAIATKQAIKLYELLNEKAPLIHEGNKKNISGTAYKIIEAFRLAFNKDFKLKMSINNEKLNNTLEDNAGEIYHVYGVFE